MPVTVYIPARPLGIYPTTQDTTGSWQVIRTSR
ncbi:hypothetical protein ACFL3J_00460 [Candidatus Omnitrophota bacterium]